jgi:hypothetical protein
MSQQAGQRRPLNAESLDAQADYVDDELHKEKRPRVEARHRRRSPIRRWRTRHAYGFWIRRATPASCVHRSPPERPSGEPRRWPGLARAEYPLPNVRIQAALARPFRHASRGQHRVVSDRRPLPALRGHKVTRATAAPATQASNRPLERPGVTARADVAPASAGRSAPSR